jgi:acetyl esterase/lipase
MFFRDEVMIYAQRLVSAGVKTEFHLYPGVPHAFEMAQGLRLTELAHLNRIRAIQSF